MKPKPLVRPIQVELSAQRVRPAVVIQARPPRVAQVYVAQDRVETQARAQAPAEAVYVAPDLAEVRALAPEAAVDRVHVVMIRNRARVRPRSVRPPNRQPALPLAERKPAAKPVRPLARPSPAQRPAQPLAQPSLVQPHVLRRARPNPVQPPIVQNANATNDTPILTSPEPG